jgi:hypothetical protein
MAIIIGVLTAVLIIVTLWYAVLTRRMVLAQEHSARSFLSSRYRNDAHSPIPRQRKQLRGAERKRLGNDCRKRITGNSRSRWLRQLSPCTEMGLPHFVGSDSLSLQTGGLRGRRNQPGAEQFSSGAAVHLTFERLQPVDLAFNGAVAPSFGNRGLNRQKIPPQLVFEVLDGCDASRTSSLHPAMQGRDVPGVPLFCLQRSEFGLSENRPESHHQSSHRRISRTTLFQRVDDFSLAARELWPRLGQ